MRFITTAFAKTTALAGLTATAAALAVCPAAMADPPAQTFWETVDGQSTRFGIKDAEPGTTPAGTRVAGHVIYMGLPKADKGTKAHVDIPESVTHDGVTYGVSRIGEYAFQDDTALTSVSIPEGVEKIYMGAFSNCSSLESVSVPKTLSYIGYSSFKNCVSLCDIDLSNVNYSISPGAFAQCKSLATIKLSSKLRDISYRAFQGSGLESVYANPSYFSTGTFSCCYSLKVATIGNRVKYVDAGYTFRNSKKLKTLTIKSSKLDKKNARALLKGSYIKTVKVPKKLVSRYKAYYAKPIKSSIEGVRTVKVKVKAL